MYAITYQLYGIHSELKRYPLFFCVF